MSQKPIRLLLVGTGSMAENHVKHFRKIPGVDVVAGVDITEERVKTFCQQHKIPKYFTDLDEAVAWGEFNAVTNVTPDAVHHPTVMKLLESKKPILCEKPLAPSYPLALEMTEAAKKAGVVAMVNLRYRELSVMQMARALVEDGLVGDIRHIDAAYLQSWLVGTHWGDWRTEERWLWRLSGAHGSRGVLGDVGIHILDFASYVADQFPTSIHCRLKTFGKAEGDHIGAYRLDANDSFVMSCEFDGGALGVVHASRWMTGYANAMKLAVFGTRGGLEIWFESEKMGLRVCAGPDVHTQTWRDVDSPPVPNTYQTFIDAVRAGETLEPSFRRAAELQHVLDLAFESDRLGTALRVERAPSVAAAEAEAQATAAAPPAAVLIGE
jgi:predicted dehydrogenase